MGFSSFIEGWFWIQGFLQGSWWPGVGEEQEELEGQRGRRGAVGLLPLGIPRSWSRSLGHGRCWEGDLEVWGHLGTPKGALGAAAGPGEAARAGRRCWEVLIFINRP